MYLLSTHSSRKEVMPHGGYRHRVSCFCRSECSQLLHNMQQGGARLREDPLLLCKWLGRICRVSAKQMRDEGHAIMRKHDSAWRGSPLDGNSLKGLAHLNEREHLRGAQFLWGARFLCHMESSRSLAVDIICQTWKNVNQNFRFFQLTRCRSFGSIIHIPA